MTTMARRRADPATEQAESATGLLGVHRDNAILFDRCSPRRAEGAQML